MRCRCKECGGKSICEHNKVRLFCKECEGSQICEHGKTRYICKECGGKAYCIHDKLKRNCKECDFGGYLSNIISCRVRDALRENKELHSKEYICCSIEEFKNHIESQFKDGMSWENHGEWHTTI